MPLPACDNCGRHIAISCPFCGDNPGAITRGIACVNESGEVVAIILDEWGKRLLEPLTWATRYPGTTAVPVKVVEDDEPEKGGGDEP